MDSVWLNKGLFPPGGTLNKRWVEDGGYYRLDLREGEEYNGIGWRGKVKPYLGGPDTSDPYEDALQALNEGLERIGYPTGHETLESAVTGVLCALVELEELLGRCARLDEQNESLSEMVLGLVDRLPGKGGHPPVGEVDSR